MIPITTSHPELGWDSNREVPGMTRTGRYEALDVEVPNNRCVRGRSSAKSCELQPMGSQMSAKDDGGSFLYQFSDLANGP